MRLLHPGMIISAKGLLDKNPDPTRAEAADAIKNNICRCTGYKKIIDGILLAGKYKREGLPPQKEYAWKMGERVPRLDVREKVLGYGEYPDDMEVEGMIYGSALRSAYPRALVKAIHTEEAKKLPGRGGGLYRRGYPGRREGRASETGLGRHDPCGKDHPLSGRRHRPCGCGDAGDRGGSKKADPGGIRRTGNGERSL